MEANQEDVVAAAMLGDAEQGVNAFETRLTCQIVRDVGDRDRLDRIHHDVAVVHLVAAADLDASALPDADAASDDPAPDPLAKAFGEDHGLSLTG